MLERCRLFLLIALGETILTTGAAIAGKPVTPLTALVGTAALVGTVALWSLGFGRAGRLIERYVAETRDPVRATHHAVGILMVMVAGLIATAVANEAAIARPRDQTPTVVAVLLCGGPVLFLLAQGWYLRALLHIRPRYHLVGGALLGGAAGIAVAIPAAAALVLVAAGLTALAWLDRP